MKIVRNTDGNILIEIDFKKELCHGKHEKQERAFTWETQRSQLIEDFLRLYQGRMPEDYQIQTIQSNF